jgi:regulator of sirC expression with transglutaminase-like and TPR domain
MREAIHEFARYVGRPEPEIDLAEASLLIARTDYPELDTAAQLARLDSLAAQVPTGPECSPLTNIQALNVVLFDKEKFAGNDEEYDDPRNSYLNQVLDRKKGIPITLSLVYTEVARRRALPLVGVGFPGHFLVKYLATPAEIYIDPYNRGAILNREDCAERLKAHFGEDAELRPEYLAASTAKQILARMLSNLKGSYFRRRNYAKVLLMIDLALAVDPGSRHELHDRGMVYFLMKRYREAMADFNLYLELAAPDDSQAKQVKQAIHQIRAIMN